jgi:hypothetical protein
MIGQIRRVLSQILSSKFLERSMKSRTLVALSTGVAALWLTQWGRSQAIEAFAEAHWNSETLPLLPSAMMDVMLTTLPLLPGLCAGLICGRRGILIGGLTGLIGGFTYSVLFILFRLHFSHLSHFFTSIGAPMWFQIQGLGLIISCAAGGAVGELLRSNNRFERSRVASSVSQGGDR